MTGYVAGQGENRNNGGFFGGDWGWIVLLLLFGWGGGGYGFGGGFGGGAALQGMATRADINEGFALNNITGGITAIQQGIADSTYALNNTITNGFHGVDRGMCDLSRQLSDCCCENRAAIADLKYTIATEDCATRNMMQNNTRDIIDSQNAGTRAILDFLTQDKISTLTAENQALRFQASQVAQNQFITQVGSDIVNRLNPPAIPSYSVPNPYTGWHNGYGWGGNCGGCCA